jgi:CHAT domain-containing protein
MGKYNEAEELIDDAITLTEKTAGKKSSPYAIGLNNQAMILQAVGRYPNAEPILNQAIDIAGETLNDKSTNYVRLMTNLALLYQDMKKYSEAEAIYNKAIKIKESRLGTNHPDYAHLLNNLAALYMLMNKYDKVEDLLKKSTAIYKRQFGENHPSYANSISNLGNFYRVMNRTSEAEPLLKQSLDIRKKSLGENHPEYVNSLEGLGLLYWQTAKYKEASELLKLGLNKNVEQINSYFAPMSEAEKAKFWDKIRPKFLKFNSFVCDAYPSDPTLAGDLYNYQLITKALLLNSSNKIKQEILLSGDQALIAEYKQWLDEKENLGRLYSLSKAELAQEHINVDSIEQVCNAREKKLSAKSSLFSQGLNNNNKTYKDIQQVLNTSEAAVEIIQFNKFNKVFTDTVYYVGLVLTKEPDVPKLILLENGKLLEKRFYNIYKNSIKQRLKDDNSYQQFWSKIDFAIGPIKNIFVSLDGIYNQINLNTLNSGQGTLIDLKNIRVVTNTKDIIELKNNSKVTSTNTAILFGFPDYGPTGSIPKLPGTKTEIESIKSILTLNKCTTKTYLAADANEANLKEIDNPKILHIATHGFFLPENDEAADEKIFGIESSKSKENPLLRSGLMMAGAEFAMEGKSENGILFAYEAMNMSLDKTEIVVMSACETGLGDVKNGEGVYGLQRAFQVAGAKAIIMSLWKVNDQATQQLMTSFYKNYSLTGDKNTAFKKAQQELKNKFKDPYYWGAFVMIE